MAVPGCHFALEVAAGTGEAQTLAQGGGKAEGAELD